MKNLSFNKGKPYGLYFFLFALLLWHPMEATANSAKLIQNSITGVVTDAIGPMPGVTISIKGSAVSITTD